MNEGANCFAPEIIQAGFSMFPCWVGQGTEKPREPHQNRCTVFDGGRSPRQRMIGKITNHKIQTPNNFKIQNYKYKTNSLLEISLFNY